MSVYNKEQPEFLRGSIESMLKQTAPPSDFVIVADGPLNDALDAVLDEYNEQYKPLFQIIRLPKNEGQGIALQKGLLHCKNELVARMDSDDISLPERCRLQLAAFANYPGLAIVGGQINEFETEPGKPYASRKVPLTQTDIAAYAKKRNPFNHMTVMFIKQVVLDAGNYQPFPLFEDYWLWVRMLLNGAAVANLPHTLVAARAGGNMIARRGGSAYAKKHAAFQRAIYELGFIGKGRFIVNTLIRVSVSIIPGWLRRLIYKNALR
jgi:glycosyltransferase involved in cell wall biosynthesis